MSTAHQASAVYAMTDEEYHAQRGLSCSQAKLLLDCPARYLHRLFSGEDNAAHFDLGSAAHRLVLGAGKPLAVIDGFDDWRKADAKAARAAAYDAGRVPLLRKDYDQVEAIAAALKAHTTAAALLAVGQPEVSIAWQDATGIDLRARLDWWRDDARAICVDVKTTTDASPRAFARTVANLRYHLQAAWYGEGARIVFDLEQAPHFVFVAQEKDPPYITAVYELDDDALDAGRRLMRKAIDTFVECDRTDTWPAYPATVLSLPRWATNPQEN